MANQRTRDIAAAGPSIRSLNLANNARRRLQEEAIKLNRAIHAAQERLREIDEEEELLAGAMAKAADEVEVALAKTTPPAEES